MTKESEIIEALQLTIELLSIELQRKSAQLRQLQPKPGQIIECNDPKKWHIPTTAEINEQNIGKRE